MKKDRSSVAGQILLAQAYEMKGRSKEAIAEYQLFLTEEPSGTRADVVKKKITKLQGAG